MTNSPPIKVGVIGCGNISQAYFAGCKTFPILKVIHCADLDTARAEVSAREFEIPRHGTVEQLLADSEVDLVVNLTVPKAHAAVNLAALRAGKHIYCEKPFCINREEGRQVIAAAGERKLLIGCAPDTFMGEGHQTCRKLIDSGAIGPPVAAVAFMGYHGPETTTHPNPAFFYDVGAGPMFDMGPYYLTALIHLMGPMRRVGASTRIMFPERFTSKGAKIEVKTPTHLSGTIDFHNGVIATMMMSFDIWSHHLPCLEIYGSEGTLAVPDPNHPAGDVLLRESSRNEWRKMPVAHAPIPHRGVGVAEMAYAIRYGRLHRPSGEMAFHVVDAMQAFDESSASGRHVVLGSTCAQPKALPAGLKPGQLDA